MGPGLQVFPEKFVSVKNSFFICVLTLVSMSKCHSKKCIRLKNLIKKLPNDVFRIMHPCAIRPDLSSEFMYLKFVHDPWYCKYIRLLL